MIHEKLQDEDKRGKRSSEGKIPNVKKEDWDRKWKSTLTGASKKGRPVFRMSRFWSGTT